jgi:hypothetical protein
LVAVTLAGLGAPARVSHDRDGRGSVAARTI